MPIPILDYKDGGIEIFGFRAPRKQMESSARINAAMNLRREGVSVEGVNSPKPGIAESSAQGQKLSHDRSELLARVRENQKEEHKRVSSERELLDKMFKNPETR